MADLKKKDEVVKFTDGQKVYVPKNTFAFDTELVEVFNVFQDDGAEGILLVNKEGHLIMRPRTMLFAEIDLAKQYYLNWMRVMHDKLAENWFPKPAEEATAETAAE
jgi:hypothetical protein